MFWPVTQLASGEHRNSATCAISSGRPSRPNGMLLRMPAVEVRIVGLGARPGAAGEFDRAGGDAVDPDPLARERRGLGQGVFQDRGLDGAVGRRADRSFEPRNRRDVEDRACLGFFEVGQRRPRRPHRRQQVDRDAGGPSRFVVAGPEPRGIVYENVDAAESVGRFCDVAWDGRGVRKVADCGVSDAAMPGDLVAGSFERFGAARANRHAGAGLGKGKCDRPPDAAAASGDDGAFAGDVDLHASSSGSPGAACAPEHGNGRA